MQWSLTRTMIVAGMAAIAFVGCLDKNGVNSAYAAQTEQVTPPQVVANPQILPTSTSVDHVNLPDFSTLVEQVGSAVVNISVISVTKTRGIQLGEDDPFFDFFRRFGIPTPGSGIPGEELPPRTSQGVGSGFIVSSDGYVLTNAHVVEGATDVTVRLTDKREFKAKVIGSDARTDVALIKVNATNLPYVRIGDAEKAKVGEWVVAVGSPFGFDNTVTAGIISAKARRLPDETYVPFIQTDVAINPGNSGGPLFNLKGEVIGINSQIYSRSGGFMGISFSIPIDVAMKVKDQLQKFGKVSRGRLGVVIQNVDKDVAQSFGLAKPTGALISTIEPAGPADKAGLQPGDIILSVDDTQINESSDLPRIIGDRSPNVIVKLKVWRNRTQQTVSVKLGEQNVHNAASVSGSKPHITSGGSKLGITVRALQPQELSRLNNIQNGLLVTRTTGAAAKQGLRAGDIILSVGNQKVTSVEQFSKLVNASGKQVPLLVARNDNQQFVVIKLE